MSDLRTMNDALLVKWRWKYAFSVEKSSPKLAHKYGSQNGVRFGKPKVSHHVSGFFKEISRVKGVFPVGSIASVGNESHVDF